MEPIDNIHFLGISWRDELPRFTYRLNRIIDVSESLLLENGNTFTIHISGKRYCVGDHGPCPYDRELTTDQKRGKSCYLCGQRDFIQYMPLKGLTDAQHDVLRTQPHFNYINCFGASLVKVGVASNHNKRKRVLEQGAFATMYFADSDGFTVRQIEDMVSSMLKIRQHVSWNAKYKFLNISPDFELLQKKFLLIYDEIKEIMPQQFCECLLPEPEIVRNDAKYQVTLPPTLSELNVLDVFHTGDVISGKIVGIYGLIILLQYEERIYAVNTRNLEGFMLSISQKIVRSNLVHPAKRIKIERPEITLF